MKRNNCNDAIGWEAPLDGGFKEENAKFPFDPGGKSKHDYGWTTCVFDENSDANTTLCTISHDSYAGSKGANTLSLKIKVNGMQPTYLPNKHMVQVANGDSMGCTIGCQKVELKLSNNYTCCKVDLLVLELGPIDIVFGCDWLSTLSSFITTNLQKGFMSFMHHGKVVVLEGMHCSKISMINDTQTKRELNEVGHDYVLQLCKENEIGQWMPHDRILD